jgi:hypothetical protein
MLPGLVRPIHSGVLLRRGAELAPAARAFLEVLLPSSGEPSAGFAKPPANGIVPSIPDAAPE